MLYDVNSPSPALMRSIPLSGARAQVLLRATKGSIGAETAKTLDDAVQEVQAISDAARGVRDDVIILCHGGPIAMPDDAEYVLGRTKHVHGFYGASSMERLPVETALTEQTRRFKAIRFRR